MAAKQYLGQLDPGDPLINYLRFDIAPQLMVNGKHSDFKVYRFTYSRDVYLYEELKGAFRVVGKFFPPDRRWPTNQILPPTETEFHNLTYLYQKGLNGSTFKITRPLGYNPELNNVLIVEYLKGKLLGDIIDQAIWQGQRDRLFRKLSALAEFLARLHNTTAEDLTVDFMNPYEYTGRLIESLIQKRGMNRNEGDELYEYRENWRWQACMWEDRSVIVHGDATPSNFKFGPGRQVMIFDLERMMWADRVFDLGRIGGELKHCFMQSTGNRFAAEPFIGHFLWEYSGYFPDHERTFHSLTKRLPFYIGITLLRIARNYWVDWEYRRLLLEEAKENLRAII